MKRGFLLRAAEKKKAAAKRGKNEHREASESKRPDATPQNINNKPNLPANGEVQAEFRVLSAEKKSEDNIRANVKVVSVGQGKSPNRSAEQMLFRTIPSPDDGDGSTEWIIHGLDSDKLELMKTKGYPTRIPKPRRPDFCEVGSTPDMGKAVFAKYNIKRGELIFSERPLLVAPRQIGGASKYKADQVEQMMSFDFEKVLEAALDRMDEKNRALYMGLCNSEPDGTLPLLGVMRTNAFAASEIIEDEGPAYSAVYGLGSRINHSCMPNVESKFKFPSFSSQFVALKDIKAGEQLFVSYCEPEKTKAERQFDLVQYGFSCKCRACVNATPATDKLRKTYASQVLHYARLLDGPQCTTDTLTAAMALEKEMIAEALFNLGRLAELIRYQSRLDEYVKIHETLKTHPTLFRSE